MNKFDLKIFNYSLIFFNFMGIFFGLLVTHSIYPVTFYSLVFSIFLIILLYFLNFFIKIDRVGFFVLVMFLSFAVKIISVFIYEFLMLEIVGIPFLSYNDDYVYEITSSEILRKWNERGIGFYNDVYFSSGFYSGYPNFSALAKMLFGDHYLVPRFLNVFFSVMTIPVVYATLKKLNLDERHGRMVLFLIAFSPIFITYSSLQLKDTILIFFLSTLVYGTIRLLKNGFGLKAISLVVFSMVALIFFRAAILFAYLISVLLVITLEQGRVTHKIKSIIWFTLILIGFYFIWEYMQSSGLLALTGEEYLESRFSGRGGQDAYQGSNNLESLGFLAVIISPFLSILSLFLPAPVYIDLSSSDQTIPYHYFPLIGYYAILPMSLVSLIYLIKNYRLYKEGIFLVLFLILYKLGQAGSKSIFDSRQSLPAIYIMYLLISYFDFNVIEVRKLWFKYRLLIIFLMSAVMFSFSFFRYSIRV